MNQLASTNFEKWEVHRAQSILKKAFALFKEYDLVYLHKDLLFWGARHVDGRGFDNQENRPTNWQIPLVRKQ